MILFNAIVTTVLRVADLFLRGQDTERLLSIALLYNLATVIPFLSLIVRRFHDLDVSPKWIFTVFIPPLCWLLGFKSLAATLFGTLFFIYIYLMLLPSKEHQKRLTHRTKVLLASVYFALCVIPDIGMTVYQIMYVSGLSNSSITSTINTVKSGYVISLLTSIVIAVLYFVIALDKRKLPGLVISAGMLVCQIIREASVFITMPRDSNYPREIIVRLILNCIFPLTLAAVTFVICLTIFLQKLPGPAMTRILCLLPFVVEMVSLYFLLKASYFDSQEGSLGVGFTFFLAYGILLGVLLYSQTLNHKVREERIMITSGPGVDPQHDLDEELEEEIESFLEEDTGDDL